jgi:hypothetical protein
MPMIAGMKLGRNPKKFNAKTLMLSKYLLPDLPEPPAKVYREWKVPASAWGMYGNNVCGDCTLAAKAHILMMMTAHTAGAMFVPDPADIIAAYSAISGYNPATGANDNGCAMTDVLDYFQTTGIAGHKILGWAAIDSASMHQGIYIFGVVDVGVNLPNSALNQTQAGQSWDVVPDDGGIAGGHDVPYFGYGGSGATCVTWGATQPSTNAWDEKYIEESYVILTQDWLNNASGLAPNTLNLDALTADLAAIKA